MSAAQTFTASRRVEFRDTDAAGIMHFSVFFTMMEEAEHEFLRHLGQSVMQHDGVDTISWPRVAASCNYAKPARFEDCVDLELSIAKLGNSSVRYRIVFNREGERLAEGAMTTVCCKLHPEQPPEPVRIPEDIRDKLAGYVEDSPENG